MSEAVLVRAWFAIKSRSWTFNKLRFAKCNKLKNIENLALNWFKKISKQLVLNKYNYKCTRMVMISKKNENFRVFISNLYDRIIQKAVYKVLYVVLEGHFYWEKLNQETVRAHYYEAIHYKQIVKEKKRRGYWARCAKVKPIFSPLSYDFRFKKEAYSVVKVVGTWNFSWLASYNFSKLFNRVNIHIFVQKLSKYIEDRRLTTQIIKLFKMQAVERVSVGQNNIGDILQDNLLLLFNFYMSSFDKFVKKIIKGVIETDNSRWRFWTDRQKKLAVSVSHQAIKKRMEWTRRETHFEKISIRANYVRYNDSFLIGFLMNKAQSMLIMENLYKHIKYKLRFDVSKKALKYIFSDEIEFLGFDIKRMPLNRLKYFKNKKLEIYKRHQNKHLNKRAWNYIKFLKAAEWMGREAIISTVIKQITSQKCFFVEKGLREVIVRLVPQKGFFYYKRKPHKKIELALKIRYDDQYLKLNKWINTQQGLLTLSKKIQLTKIVQKNLPNKLRHVSKKVIELKYEKGYLLKFKLLKTNSIKINCITEPISMFTIVPSKKQVLEEFKRKSVLNSQGIPIFAVENTFLSDIAIISWYSKISKRLLSYYGCIDNFNDLRHQVNWTLRYSLFKTIGAKYNKSIGWVISHFGFDSKVTLKNQLITNFPSSRWVNSRKKKYLIQAWGKKNTSFLRNSHLLYLNQTGVWLDNLKYKNSQ